MMETFNPFSTRFIKHTTIALIAIASLGLSGCYSSSGDIPEQRKPQETKLWTDQQVDEVVDINLVTLPATEAAPEGAPDACNNLNILRIKSKFGPQDAEQADAVFLMVPGVLEGANAFEFMGRQMVYMAQQEQGRFIEVWGMDRRSNCLEDLTGVQLAEQTDDIELGINQVIDYYYEKKPLEGKTFTGFLRSRQLPFLSEFGMRQTTLDIKAIIDHMMPTPGVSKNKLFLGGHSLGGIHTSLFLAWDFDGDPTTEEDAGYNLVAAAFGLDTQLTPVIDGLYFGTAAIPAEVMTHLDVTMTAADASSSENDPERNTYERQLALLRQGTIPRNVDIPGIFTPEILALPEFIALAAAKAPDTDSRLIDRVPKSLALQTITRFLHSRYLPNIFRKPLLKDFNYTNEALVGLFFDDDFEPLGFLQTGLGFVDGGPVVRKWKILDTLKIIPGVDVALQQLFGVTQLYIASNAGPNRFQFGKGPLYGWAHRDEIGDLDDPDFMDVSGTKRFTYLENEPVDMDDFVRALYVGETNLTEWYFPVRIMLDSFIASKPFAPDFGIDVLHPTGVENIDSIVFTANQGVKPINNGNAIIRNQTLIDLPGYTHLDPMFEAVNSPSLTSQVMRPLMAFAFSRIP
ncbi:MAG: hypothetical protein MI976_14860 [Pseudomonadales bacterium]|nr:hypothetical protein [Pseudomonadales bacterium]